MVKFGLGDTIGSKVTSVLGIIMILLVASNLIPVIQGVASDFANFPLGSIFTNGIVLTLIAVGVFITVVKISFPERR